LGKEAWDGQKIRQAVFAGPFFEQLLSGDAFAADSACVVSSGIYPLPNSCQRAAASILDRAAQ